MAKYTFEEIKSLLLKSINEEHIEAERSLVRKQEKEKRQQEQLSKSKIFAFNKNTVNKGGYGYGL